LQTGGVSRLECTGKKCGLSNYGPKLYRMSKEIGRKCENFAITTDGE